MKNYNSTINEGWLGRAWQSTKYALSKLGRYKAGGKILGKQKVDSQSIAKITKIVQKIGNEKIKELNNRILEALPEFPNNKSQEEFIDMCLEIAKVYDSIVAATESDPESDEYIPVDVANTIIEDLREYVKEFLDVKLAAVYSVTNEQSTLDAKRAQFRSKMEPTKSKIKSGDLQQFDSERMKTLKSWRLPLSLMGTGASFGALGWLIKALCSDEKEITIKVLQEASQQVADIQPGEGMTQILNRAFNLNLSPNSSPGEFINAVKLVGNGSVDKGVELLSAKGGIFTNPDAARETLTAIADNPEKYGNTLKDIFKGTWAGTGAAPGDTLTTVPGGKLSAMIMQWGIKTATVAGAKYAVAAKVLSGVGVGLLAGGVAVALARWKGRKSSRAQVLNDLYQSMRPIKSTEENPAILPTQQQQTAGTVPPAAPIVNQSTSDLQKDLQALQKYNRNAQIALVLARISENLSLAKLLGANTIDNYTDTQLKGIIQKDKTAPAAKIAALIINIRKNPDGFLTKISKMLGVQLEKRARGVSTSPARSTKAPLVGLKEKSTLREAMLLEAMVDDVFKDFGITPQILEKNKIQVLGLLGAMYAKEGDTSLSILDVDKLNLSSSDKKDLETLGFAPQSGGNYAYLGKGGKKSSVVSKKQVTEIIKEEVLKYKQSLRNRKS